VFFIIIIFFSYRSILLFLLLGYWHINFTIMYAIILIIIFYLLIFRFFSSFSFVSSNWGSMCVLFFIFISGWAKNCLCSTQKVFTQLLMRESLTFFICL
jgi:hypothetical protein